MSETPTASKSGSKQDAGKMQQLLGLARERLREQQLELEQRATTIDELRAELELAGQTSVSTAAPLRAICHVVEDGHWVLFEFEQGSEWRRFESPDRLEDFVRRDAGSEPLQVPEPVLTVDDARRVRESAEAQVARIADDFRKYRVQVEIQRKQREAQEREATAMREVLNVTPENDDDDEHVPSLTSEVDALRTKVNALQAENERLRSTGPAADAALAAQWRQRYEAVHLDRKRLEDAVQALKEGGAGSSEYAKLARDHDELKRDFKTYRAQAIKALRDDDAPKATLDALGDRSRRPRNSSRANDDSTAKLQYLKNLMLNYFAAPDPKAKEHMERAIATVLNFSQEEKSHIDSVKPSAASSIFG